MFNLRKIFCLLAFILSFLSSYTQENSSGNLEVALYCSPLQIIGLRFPIIAELNYGNRFATQIGMGPTIGKDFLAGLILDIGEFRDRDRTKIEKRNVGIQFQCAQKIYFKKGAYLNDYISFLYRFGYFPTEMKGKDTFMKKNQFYLYYGKRVKEGKTIIDYWYGLGFSKIKYLFYQQVTDRRYNEVIEDDFQIKLITLPAFILGFNIGFEL